MSEDTTENDLKYVLLTWLCAQSFLRVVVLLGFSLIWFFVAEYPILGWLCLAVAFNYVYEFVACLLFRNMMLHKSPEEVREGLLKFSRSLTYALFYKRRDSRKNLR